MRIRPRIIAAVLLVTQIMVAPAVARACSCIPSTIWRSDPTDGASDVPLNQALVVEGFLSAQSIKLEDASGSQVEFDLDPGPTPGCPGTWAELLPRKPLAPMTQYRIRVASTGAIDPDRSSVTFTTGTRVLPEENLPTPKGRASVVEDIPPSGVSCGPSTVMACVGLEDYLNVEMVARRGDEIIMRWLFSEDTMDGNFGFGVVPDCLEFRRRAATGQRSAPLTICGESLGTRSFRPSDMSGPSVRCRAGVIGVQESNASDAARPTQDEDAGVNVGQSEATDATDPKLSSNGCSAGPRGQAPEAATALLLLMAATSRRPSRRPAKPRR